MTWARWFSACGMAAIALGSCGGTAVVDGDNGDGGSGAGAGNGSSSSSNSSSSSSMSSTSSGTSSLCELACAYVQPCLDATNCVANCQNNQGGCQAPHEAWLSCLVGNDADGVCAQPTQCNTALAEWLKCVGANGSGGCAIDPSGSCSCFSQVGPWDYESFCTGSGDCQCMLFGQLVGKCVTGPGQNSCDALFSCCGTVFFVPGLPPGEF